LLDLRQTVTETINQLSKC